MNYIGAVTENVTRTRWKETRMITTDGLKKIAAAAR
jgi:hypothetical protein